MGTTKWKRMDGCSTFWLVSLETTTRATIVESHSITLLNLYSNNNPFWIRMNLSKIFSIMSRLKNS